VENLDTIPSKKFLLVFISVAFTWLALTVTADLDFQAVIVYGLPLLLCVFKCYVV